MVQEFDNEQLKKAYEDGLNQMKDRKLGGSTESTYFLLPLGISRDKEFSAVLNSLSEFDSLDENEKIAIHIIYETIHNNIDLINIYPNVLGEISILECEARDLKSKPLRVSKAGQFDENSKERFNRVCSIVQDLTKIIRREGAPDLTLPFSRPALVLNRRRRLPGEWQDARSWLGGLPKLGNQSWPRHMAQAMQFIAQIDCASIREAAEIYDIPENGALAFFISTKGKSQVVYVPAEEISEYTELPSLPSSLRDSGGRTGYECNAQGAHVFPYWPLEIVAVGIDRSMDEETVSQKQKAAAIGDPRKYNLSAKQVFQEDSMASRPQWWNTAIGLKNILCKRRDETEAQKSWQFYLIAMVFKKQDQLEERKAFDRFCQEVEDWVSAKEPWERLGDSDAKKLENYIGRASKEFRSFFKESYLLSILEDLTLINMFTGSEELFEKLPSEAVEKINQNFLRPIHGINQMFGLPGSVQGNALIENSGKHLLLQLCSDDMMCWEFGLCQFWIKPEDLESGNWSKANVSFESD